MMMKQRAFSITLAAVALVVIAPVALGQQSGSIMVGDVIVVDVQRQPELSTTARVDESGSILVPFVGNVAVAGLTENAARDRITDALRKYLRNPRVRIARGLGGGVLGTRTGSMMTETVSLKNASAENLATSLQGMSSPGGTISFDGDTNTLIITDRPDVIQNVKMTIFDLDSMQSQLTQVSISTKFAEVQEGALKEIGVRWFTQGKEVAGGFTAPGRLDPEFTSIRPGGSNESVGTGSGTNSNSRRFVGGETFDRRLNIPVQVPLAGQLFFGLLNRNLDLGIFIDALVSDKKAELLASPMVLTVNHKTARIKMTDEFPFTESLAGVGFSQTTIDFLDIGIIMEVTPHVLEDKTGPYIKLDLRPEVSFLAGTGANGVPIRSVRSSHSIVNVRDGQTLVIGGVFREEDRDIVQGVPGVSKIPIFGNLFKRKEKNRSRSELIMFVTPRIHLTPEDITWDTMMDISPFWPREPTPVAETKKKRRGRKRDTG